MLTNAQYALISPTPFLYPNHPGPIIILDSTTDRANSNMRIAHTKKVRLFQEVMGVEQALVHKIIYTSEEAHLVDICNRTTNYIYNTVTDVLTHLQDNYVQLMPHELLERKYIIKKAIFNPQYPISTLFSTIE